MCIYVCVWSCFDKYISVATWPPQTKIPGSAPEDELTPNNIIPTGDVQRETEAVYFLISFTNLSVIATLGS